MWHIDMWDIDMWDIDLSDTDLDLLDKDIPSKHFVCLQDVWRLQDMSSRHVFKTSSRQAFKTSSRQVFKTSSRHVFKTCRQDVFSVTIFPLKTFWRRLQDQQMFARLIKNIVTSFNNGAGIFLQLTGTDIYSGSPKSTSGFGMTAYFKSSHMTNINSMKL